MAPTRSWSATAPSRPSGRRCWRSASRATRRARRCACRACGARVWPHTCPAPQVAGLVGAPLGMHEGGGWHAWHASMLSNIFASRQHGIPLGQQHGPLPAQPRPGLGSGGGATGSRWILRALFACGTGTLRLPRIASQATGRMTDSEQEYAGRGAARGATWAGAGAAAAVTPLAVPRLERGRAGAARVPRRRCPAGAGGHPRAVLGQLPGDGAHGGR